MSSISVKVFVFAGSVLQEKINSAGSSKKISFFIDNFIDIIHDRKRRGFSIVNGQRFRLSVCKTTNFQMSCRKKEKIIPYPNNPLEFSILAKILLFSFEFSSQMARYLVFSILQKTGHPCTGEKCA